MIATPKNSESFFLFEWKNASNCVANCNPKQVILCLAVVVKGHIIFLYLIIAYHREYVQVMKCNTGVEVVII